MRTSGLKRRLGAFVAATVVMVGLGLATAQPASAASYTVKFSGVVICSSSTMPVKGVWVNNFDGSDGFASWWAFPGKTNAAKYSITVTANRPDPAIRLDIGCGGTTSSWNKTLLTNDFRTRNGYHENRRCDSGAANRARACLPAPKGPTTTYNMGSAGYCTWGAYAKWKAFTGYYPSIGGHAYQMDNNARAKGFQVSSVPHAASMVVFNTSGLGHVGWVTKVYKSSTGKVVFDYVDMNGGTGATAANGYKTTLFNKWATKTAKAWDPAIQAFIVAPT